MTVLRAMHPLSPARLRALRDSGAFWRGVVREFPTGLTPYPPSIGRRGPGSAEAPPPFFSTKNQTVENKSP